MARYENPFAGGGSPYPTDPTWAVIGQSLGTALFGDPAAAREKRESDAKIQAMVAQAEADRQRGGLYGEQASAQRQIIDARGGLPELIRSLISPPSPALPTSPSVGAGGGYAPPPASPGLEGVAQAISEAAAERGIPLSGVGAPQAQAPSGVSLDQFREGLPGFVAALLQGEVDNPDEVVAMLSAFGGDDELARRGMIGRGTTPGEWFALTPDRADNIREQGFDASFREKKYDADRQFEGTAYNADRDKEASIYNSDRDYQASTENNRLDNVTDWNKHITPSGNAMYKVKAGARVTNQVGASIIGAALPGATITENARTDAENARLDDSAPNSHHLVRRGANGFDVRKVPGLSFAEADRRVRAAAAARGAQVVERKTYSDHWHWAIVGGSTTGKVKPVSVGDLEKFDGAISARLGSNLSPKARAAVRERAVSLYQQNGNADLSIRQAVSELQWLARSGGTPAPSPGRKASGGAAQAAVGAATMGRAPKPKPATPGRGDQPAPRPGGETVAQAKAKLGMVYPKATPQSHPGLFRNGKKIPLGEAIAMVEARFR